MQQAFACLRQSECIRGDSFSFYNGPFLYKLTHLRKSKIVSLVCWDAVYFQGKKEIRLNPIFDPEKKIEHNWLLDGFLMSCGQAASREDSGDSGHLMCACKFGDCCHRKKKGQTSRVSHWKLQLILCIVREQNRVEKKMPVNIIISSV